MMRNEAVTLSGLTFEMPHAMSVGHLHVPTSRKSSGLRYYRLKLSIWSWKIIDHWLRLLNKRVLIQCFVNSLNESTGSSHCLFAFGCGCFWSWSQLSACCVGRVPRERRAVGEFSVWYRHFDKGKLYTLKILLDPKPVIPKVCSADHWWSARLAQVVRQSL